ncbi:hypothetical protein HJG60_008074 [Phyllostomus discolor]|uniref:Uncharacterized protein n=1 Tax=Phyllostomus discolor TaxID=89673 RepID=A0A834BLL3_9CHIR|nr:hypothetical protein HJG60_008074 [Phyllostomus discolor]
MRGSDDAKYSPADKQKHLNNWHESRACASLVFSSVGHPRQLFTYQTGELILCQFPKPSPHTLTTPDLCLERQAAHSTSVLGFSHKHLEQNMVKAALKPSHVNLLPIFCSTTWYSERSLSRNRHNGA